jgi:SMI1-KNR4 cell-wall
LPAPSEERIHWFEEAYRVQLPADYIEALKAGNGAVPIRKTFLHGNRERLVERLLCLLPKPQNDQTNGWYDLSVVLTQLDARLIDNENLVGMNVIPIAVLFAGDFVCLDFRKNPQQPTIAVWDHERSDEFDPVLETVAASFAEFDRRLA